MKRPSLSVKQHYLIAGIIRSITAAGDYTATLVSASGCDSIATLHLVINPVVTGEETITICEAALPYSWNGTDLSLLPVIILLLLLSATGCDSDRYTAFNY